MKKNKSGFSIIIGMGLVVLITLSAFVILEYMVPYSKNTKGIENASNAYYNTYGGIEQALTHIKTRTDLTTETSSGMSTTDNVSKCFSTYSSGNTIPKPGQGNSPYNKDYNIISMNEPIQLEVGKNNIKDGSNIRIDIQTKIPAFTGGTLSLSGTQIYLGWILSGEEQTLVASGSYITGTTINTSSNINLANLNGATLTGAELSFSNFYDSNCLSNSGCILKISVINKLELTNGNNIPFLEYKLSNFGNNSTKKIPDRYTTIESSGKSYMYKKDLKVKIPQQTVNQALDFTVFQ